jgi:hypothetical protein
MQDKESEPGNPLEALLFSRFCSFLLSAVLVFPVQSSLRFRISDLWLIGCTSINGVRVATSILFIDAAEQR